MYRLLFSVLFFSVVVSIIGCDDNQARQVIKPVIEQPTEIIDYATLPLIDEVNLQPRLYQMNILSGTKSEPKGNVKTIFSERFEGENTVEIFLHPTVPDFSDTYLDGATAVIQIYAKDDVLVNPYGDGVTYHSYHGSIMTFLKHPDAGKIVYQYQPSGYENLPVLKQIFATKGEVLPGQYLVFPESLGADEIKNEVIVDIITKVAEKDDRIRVFFNPRPLIVGKNNQLLFDFTPTGYVIEIIDFLGLNTVKIDGMEYKTHDYTGKLIKSFTSPHIEILYEEDNQQ